jgi:hypothetical protein
VWKILLDFSWFCLPWFHIVGINWYASIPRGKFRTPLKSSIATRIPWYLAVIKGLRHSKECVNAVVKIVIHKLNLNYDASCFRICTVVNMITLSNTHPHTTVYIYNIHLDILNTILVSSRVDFDQHPNRNPSSSCGYLLKYTVSTRTNNSPVKICRSTARFSTPVNNS